MAHRHRVPAHGVRGDVADGVLHERLRLTGPIDEDHELGHGDTVRGAAVAAQWEVPLDTRAAERGKRALDALRLRRVRRVDVRAFSSSVGAGVEPRAGRIALESMELALVGDLEGPEFADRYRQQPAGVGADRVFRLRPQTVRPLEQPDGRGEDSQQDPDGEEPGPSRDRTQCCFHHTAVPTTARTAGTRSTERKNTPFIWRFVRLIRGMSAVRGWSPIRFSCAPRKLIVFRKSVPFPMM